MSRLKILGVTTLFALLLSGCFAHTPYRNNSSAVTGAVVGALIGGIAGYAIGSHHSHYGYRRHSYHYKSRRRNRGDDYGYGRRNFDGGGRHHRY